MDPLGYRLHENSFSNLRIQNPWKPSKVSTKRNPSNTVAVSEDTGGKTLPFKGPLPAFSCGETAPGSLFGGGAKARSRDQEIDWHKNGQLR